MSRSKSKLTLILLCCVLSICQLPTVRTDGMIIPDTPQDFTAIVENEQIAYIWLLNETHERISLFLGVTAIDVSVHNVTIIVPLPSVPTDVSGEKDREEMFLWEFDLNRIEELGKGQDVATAVKEVLKETGALLDLYVGCSALSPFIYVPLRYRYPGWSFYPPPPLFEGRGDDHKEPVAHWEFEGMTIDVYSVDSGMTLKEYLTKYNLAVPEAVASLAEDYSSYYVAVIRAEAFPAVEQKEAQLLAAYAPSTVAKFRNYVYEHPKFRATYQWLYDLEQNFGTLAMEEALERGADSEVAMQVRWAMQSLVDSVYAWHRNARGYRLELTIRVPENEVYYPLGTGRGWSQPIENTKIFLQLPHGLDAKFNIKPTHEAFTAEGHCYIWIFEYANPSEDLTGKIFEAGWNYQLRMLSARIAEGITQASRELGFASTVVLIGLGWFILYVFLRRSGVKIGKQEYFLSCVALTVLGCFITLFIAGMLVWYPVLKEKYKKETTASGMTILALLLFLGVQTAFHQLFQVLI